MADESTDVSLPCEDQAQTTAPVVDGVTDASDRAVASNTANTALPGSPSPVEHAPVRHVMIDDEDDTGVENVTGLPYEDHNYDTTDPSQRVKDSTEFPILPTFAELGIHFDELPSDPHSRGDKVGYDHHPATFSVPRATLLTREGGVVYRSASDITRKVLIGGNSYNYSSSNSAPPTHQTYATSPYKRADIGSGVQMTSYAGAATRRLQSGPVATSSLQPLRKTLGGNVKPGSGGITKTIGRVLPPPVPHPQAEPPHRALLTGKPMVAPPPPTSYQPASIEPSDSGIPRGGAPLLIAGRGAKPVIRGKVGSSRRRDGDPDENMDDPGMNVYGRPGSPRKSVSFTDGIPPGGATMSSAAGVVNLVVGAPPPGSVTVGGYVAGRPSEVDWQAEEAVQQNLQAIHESLESHHEQVPPPAEPLPMDIQQKMFDGEASSRTLDIRQMVLYKRSVPELPPDPVPEPRPRGRPRGSTNRNRASSSSNVTANSPVLPTSQLATSPGSAVIGNEAASPQTRASPPKFATSSSPQRGVAGSSPPKIFQAGDNETLTPLVPPSIPPLNEPSSLTLGGQPLAKGTSFPSVESEMPPPPLSTGVNVADISSATESDESSTDESDDSDAESDYSKTTVEEDWGDYTTRCWCDMGHNDEDMIECDRCNVWQHMKCMGINPKKVPDSYLCEQCNARQLKWNKEQARDYQERKLREIEKAREKRRTDRRKRNEERRKRNEKRKKQKQAERAARKAREKARRKAAKPASGLQFRKYTEIADNEYTDRAKKILGLKPTTPSAQQVVENTRNAEPKYGRMFVAPGIEGIVAIRDIQKGDLVMEYLGHVSVPSECPGREKEGFLQPYTVLYSGLNNHDSQLVIDARRKGGDSRFVRRSCRPNTVLRHVILDGSIHVLLNATETIERSMEITIPFDSDYQSCQRALMCACGDEACCPIADFNARIARSPSPSLRKSSGAPPTSKRNSMSTTPASVSKKKARPSTSSTVNGTKTVKKPAESPKQRGRPAKIKLRRPDQKEAEDKKPNKKTTSDSEEQDQGEKEDRRRTRATRKADSPVVEEDVKNVDRERRSMRRSRGSEVKSESASEKGNKKEEALEKESPKKRSRTITQSSSKSDADEEKSAPVLRGRRSMPVKQEAASPKKTDRSPSESARNIARGAEKPEMDYTLPEERNKMTREERKLQQELALIAKLEGKDKGQTLKSTSPMKDVKKGAKLVEEDEKRGPGRPRRSSVRKESQTEMESKVREEDEERGSPRSFVPPRKRWQMEAEQQERDEMATASLSSGNMTSPPPDLSQGKKAWFLRRAQADREKDEPAPPDPAPSAPAKEPSVPPPEAARIVPPPLKKRRPISSDERAPASFSPATKQNSRGKEPGIRDLMLTFAKTLVSCEAALDFTLPDGPEHDWPAVSQVKRKKLSLDEYKKRRVTADSALSQSSADAASQKRSFIPNIQDATAATLHLAPVPDPRALSTGAVADLDELKRRIYGGAEEASTSSSLLPPPEPRLNPPPPPPSLARTSPSKASRGAGEQTDEERPRQRMSLADRLKVEFGIDGP